MSKELKDLYLLLEQTKKKIKAKLKQEFPNGTKIRTRGGMTGVVFWDRTSWDYLTIPLQTSEGVIWPQDAKDVRKVAEL